MKLRFQGYCSSNFFFVRVVQLWNKLPENVVSASSVSAFISRLNSMHASLFKCFVLVQCVSSLTYLLGLQLLVLLEPFYPVDTVLLFTVFTVLYLC